MRSKFWETKLEYNIERRRKALERKGLTESQLALALEDNRKLKENLDILKDREKSILSDIKSSYQSRIKSLEGNLTSQISKLQMELSVKDGELKELKSVGENLAKEIELNRELLSGKRELIDRVKSLEENLSVEINLMRGS